MERDESNCEPDRASVVSSSSSARRPRGGLAVAAWPTPRRTVRATPRSAAGEASVSSPSNAAAQLQDAKPCAQEGYTGSRLHEGSSPVQSTEKQSHGQEGAGYLVPRDTPNGRQALSHGDGAHTAVTHLQEPTLDPSLAQSLERRIHEGGSGETSTEEVLDMYRASIQGSDLYTHVGGLQARAQVGRHSDGIRGKEAVVGALVEGAQGRLRVPNTGPGVFLYLESGERPEETADYWVLIRKAMADQRMTEEELRRLADLILDKATRDVTCAPKAAEICLTIIGRKQGQAFLYSLLDTCRCWYEAREEKLPRATSNAELFRIRDMGPRARVWPAYVVFVVNVLVALSYQHASSETAWTAPAMTLFSLTVLACDCFQLMLQRHALNVQSEPTPQDLEATLLSSSILEEQPALIQRTLAAASTNDVPE